MKLREKRKTRLDSLSNSILILNHVGVVSIYIRCKSVDSVNLKATWINIKKKLRIKLKKKK